MMRSLYSGVSGLKVHQTKMDVIGNNIANVNTVGFKSSTVTFKDVFYQTTQSASGPNETTGTGGQNAKQIGLGVSLGSISKNITSEGGSQRTDNPFDMKLSGDGFFIVNKAGVNYFTRAGAFTTDAAGNLVNGDGYNVMGWQADKDGNVIKDTVSKLTIKTADKLQTAAAKTEKTSFTGNINASDSSFVATKDATGNITGYTGGITMSAQIYDSVGQQYLLTFNVAKTTTANEYTVTPTSLKSADGTDRTTAIDTTQAYTTLTFDADTGALKSSTAKTPLNIDWNGAGVTGRASQPISIDFSGLTSVATETSTHSSSDGKAVGIMTGVGVQTDGRIIAAYSNGDNVCIGQIAVATFDNPAGLEAVGNTMYQTTMNSGTFDGIGEDVSAGGGSITTGVLEMSNVDLSTEFTEMITTQRGFQANSRIITVSDTMIEELTNLKR
ncbi:MAG: flagellar hook protein FlgE [Lachnospiraceae bacterium]|nr:flagellar hook protein FlgE [Lachnospiraceae bacterium]